MKIFIFLSIFISSLQAFGSPELKKAFNEFYNNEQIHGRYCGRNIQHFLKYLKLKNVAYRSGYVVSVHDDFGSLNHFDARWGSKDKYRNGEEYSRSNWYFHVFLVIDGLAFDFSQADRKVQKLSHYLSTSYIPRSETNNISLSGRFDKEKALRKYLNSKMNIYYLSDYIKNLGPKAYQGTFIELFYYANKKPLKSTRLNFKHFDISFEDSKKNRNGSISILRPRVVINGEVLPLKADPMRACRTFGFFGTLPGQSKHRVTNSKKMLKVYSSLKPVSLLNISSRDISISFAEELSDGQIPRQPLFHYLETLTCSDLFTFLGN